MAWPDPEMMKRALALAARGAGAVAPNPMVGCVVVRDGVVIGSGYHERVGGPHAEVNAIRSAAGDVRGAELHVTLEPCSHSGGTKRTPPCAPMVIESGVKRVAVAVRDPNPEVQGRGIAAMRAAGIDVHEGLCRSEAAELIRGFASRVSRARPWVAAKWAMSLDGRIATRENDAKWITGEPARHRVHIERTMLDAIMVGVGTVLADDPMLTARPESWEGVPGWRQPLRVVVDPRLRISPTAKLVVSADVGPVVVACLPNHDASERREELVRRGVEVIEVEPLTTDAKVIDLSKLLEGLAQRGVNVAQIEGGAGLLGAAFDQRVVDEVTAWIAPGIVIGGRNAKEAVGGHGVGTIGVSIRAVRSRHDLIGGDIRVQSFLTDPEALLPG